MKDKNHINNINNTDKHMDSLQNKNNLQLPKYIFILSHFFKLQLVQFCGVKLY